MAILLKGIPTIGRCTLRTVSGANYQGVYKHHDAHYGARLFMLIEGHTLKHGAILDVLLDDLSGVIIDPKSFKVAYHLLAPAIRFVTSSIENSATEEIEQNLPRNLVKYIALAN